MFTRKQNIGISAHFKSVIFGTFVHKNYISKIAMPIRKCVGSILLGLVGLAVGAEFVVRYAGLIDFPLYEANPKIGYIPKASQSGNFMNGNRWEFNSDNMGASEFAPGDGSDTLLVGDSIVYGGNGYLASDRLGPQLQTRLKSRVWPISAGSWSLQNELIWLDAHPEIVQKVENIVFVLNSEDFNPASSWSCSWTHPVEKPLSAVWYLAGKYVLKRSCEGTPAALAVVAQDSLPMLKTFLESLPTKTRVMFFLYPDKLETGDDEKLAAGVETMQRRLQDQGAVEVESIGRHAKWMHQTGFYKDGIHPESRAMPVLADVIGSAMEAPRQFSPKL